MMGRLIRLRVTSALIFVLACILGGCFSTDSMDFQRAERAAKAKQPEEAIKYYYRVIQRDPRSEKAMIAAREAARISYFDSRNYPAALNFYKHIVLYSPQGDERKEAQKKIALINYEQLADYRQAIAEFYKLLDLPHSLSEEFEFRFNIAKSYYFLNNFFQAQSEIETLLKHNIIPEQKFETLLLRANILLATKKMDVAAETYLKIIQEFPERAKKESVALNLAVCYEEQKKFHEAISTLQGLRDSYSTPEFIDLRIKRLQERASYLPGAKGLKK